MYKLYSIMFVTLIILGIVALTPTHTNAQNDDNQCWECRTGWIIDYGYVVFTENKTEAYFDVPINYSDSTYKQEVYIVHVGGNAKLEANGSTVSISIDIFNGSKGYFIARFKICRRTDINITTLKSLENITIPSDIAKRYLKKPHPLVQKIVKKDFEQWLKNLGYKNLTKPMLAFKAAQFIYYYYISYEASALPRTIEDVIKHRKGDCDDMSRILANLLWCYGIPARLEYAYVWIPDFEIAVPIEKSYIVFENSGPHGYVLAFMGRLGWVALDLLGMPRLNPLAGSRYYFYVLIMGHASGEDVNQTVVEEVKEFHRKVQYAEIVSIMSDEEFKRVYRGNYTHVEEYALLKLRPYIEEIESRIGRRTTQTTTTTTATQRTQIPTSTTIVNTTTTEEILRTTITRIITKTITTTVTITRSTAITKTTTRTQYTTSTQTQTYRTTKTAIPLTEIARKTFSKKLSLPTPMSSKTTASPTSKTSPCIEVVIKNVSKSPSAITSSKTQQLSSKIEREILVTIIAILALPLVLILIRRRSPSSIPIK